ncbi:MAG TPA: hypothetical protein VL400_25450, partial [Polyangiaceae bacterium]|nr:hypothetical protein [Polyangiaceae bacterium]
LASSARGPGLTECRSILGELDLPARVPWTHRDATYRGEELLARDAVNRYLDAAVGDPDPSRLYERADDVKRAQDMLEKGSQRVSLEELGPAIGAPHLGKLAASIGDRLTLMDRAESFGLWDIRVEVLEASFLEADFDEVDHIAHRFADWDPRDADLRTEVGATLCLTDPRAGLAMLDRIPADRADKRYANIQRNYGEVLAVTRACAHKLGEAPPPAPSEGSAGVADADVVRLAATIRLASSDGERNEAIERSIGKLEASSLDDDAPGARAALLAGVLTLRGEITPALALNLVAPRTESGEGPLAPRGLTVSRILGERAGLHAYAPADWYEIAASRLEALAPRADGDEASKALMTASAALSHHAAIERALAGETALAEADARLGAAKNGLDPRATALSVASAVYVSGDALGARHILGAAPAAGGERRSADDDAVEVAFFALAAMTAASTGDRDAAARIAALLEPRAAALGASRLAVEGRWVALAFGDASSSAAPPTSFPWAGMADAHPRYAEHGALAVDESTRALRAALGASPEARRRFRYAWMDHRGDVPDLASPAMVVAGRLLDEGSSGAATETWLDALTAIDARRMRLRAYAFYRMEAARMRGDTTFGDVWAARLDVLRKLASDHEDAEIARFLRL